MKHAETVTFGGSDLDRAAHERGDADALWQQSAARAVVFWRGKPLVTVAKDSLVRVPASHPIIPDAAPDKIYLGRDAGVPTFAVDISRWDPEDDSSDHLNTFLDPSEQVHPSVAGEAVFAELRAIMTQLSPRDAELAATTRGIFGWHQFHSFCSN